MSDCFLEAGEAAIRRVEAAAQPLDEDGIVGITQAGTVAMFAGTDLPAMKVIGLLDDAAATQCETLHSTRGSLMIAFWLGYEMGRRGEA